MPSQRKSTSPKAPTEDRREEFVQKLTSLMLEYNLNAALQPLSDKDRKELERIQRESAE